MTKTKRNIFLGLGTIAAVATPVVAVVACGSSSDSSTPTQGSTHKLTGHYFMETVTAAKVEDFLKEVATSDGGGNYTANSNLTLQQYNDAADKTGHRNLFDKILSQNKNDPKLATSIVSFTWRTISSATLAVAGLVDPANGAMGTLMSIPALTNDSVDASTLTNEQKTIVKKMLGEIIYGTLDYQSIADSIIKKFSGRDPIWKMAVLSASYTVSGNQLIEGTDVGAAATPMGGISTVKAIVTAAGYQYV